MWQGWIDIVAGIWVLSCGFFNPLRLMDNMWIPGIIVAVLGAWTVIKAKSWQGLINSLIGFWLVLSGIAFSLNTEWNFVIFGSLIIIFTLWNVSANPNLAYLKDQ